MRDPILFKALANHQTREAGVLNMADVIDGNWEMCKQININSAVDQHLQCALAAVIVYGGGASQALATTHDQLAMARISNAALARYRALKSKNPGNLRLIGEIVAIHQNVGFID